VADHYDSASGLTLTASRADLLKTLAQSRPRSSGAGDTFLTVVARRNARGGRSATEHLVAALRCLYRHAEVAQRRRHAGIPQYLPDHPQRGLIGVGTGDQGNYRRIIAHDHPSVASLSAACRHGPAHTGMQTRRLAR